MEISQLNDLVNFLEKFVAFSRIIVLSCLIKRGDYGLYIYIFYWIIIIIYLWIVVIRMIVTDNSIITIQY